MDRIKIGEFGRFIFTVKKKGFVTHFDLMATVIEIDGKYIMLRDNDDMIYLPKKSDIKSFERETLVKTTRN